MTGVPPYFEMTSVSAVFRMVNDPHPPLPDDISTELQDFLLACFQRNPARRPTAAQLRNHPWIIKHTNQPSEVMDVDQVRTTIKRHTMSKESKLLEDLANLDFNADSFEEAVSSPRPAERPSTPTLPDPKNTDKRVRINSFFRFLLVVNFPISQNSQRKIQ